MKRRSISLIGVGSLRCGPPVLASIAALRLEYPLEVRLFDANEERLDLMERFARHAFEQTQSHHDLLYRPDLSEALDGAEAVVLSLYEDCARRMVGRTSTRFLLPEDPSDGRQFSDLHSGDLNRPTPISEVRPMTLAALSQPDPDSTSRQDAVEAAMQLVLSSLDDAKLLNLTRKCPVPEGTAHTQLNWPQPLEESERISLPHMILRWIHGDQDLDDYFLQYGDSPFARWLVNDLGAR